VSPGCAHCYAEVNYSVKMRGIKWGPQGERVLAADSAWKMPLKWDRDAKAAGVRRRVFCASLADVFEDRPELRLWRERLWRLIQQCPNLDWQILTKRPENFAAFLPWGKAGSMLDKAIWPNVWLGVSVEDQARADERIPLLLQTPAAVRFLSCEPLLGDVQLRKTFNDGAWWDWLTGQFYNLPVNGVDGFPDFKAKTSDDRLQKIKWVIVGGESGPNARPCNVAWVRSIVRQCKAAGVACFVKQLGASPYRDDPKDRLNIGPTGVVTQDGESRRRRNAVGEEFSRTKALMILGDKKGGDPAEWPEDLRVREFPAKGGA
jgi:protein gp37